MIGDVSNSFDYPAKETVWTKVFDNPPANHSFCELLLRAPLR